MITKLTISCTRAFPDRCEPLLFFQIVLLMVLLASAATLTGGIVRYMEDGEMTNSSLILILFGGGCAWQGFYSLRLNFWHVSFFNILDTVSILLHSRQY